MKQNGSFRRCPMLSFKWNPVANLQISQLWLFQKVKASWVDKWLISSHGMEGCFLKCVIGDVSRVTPAKQTFISSGQIGPFLVEVTMKLSPFPSKVDYSFWRSSTIQFFSGNTKPSSDWNQFWQEPVLTTKRDQYYQLSLILEAISSCDQLFHRQDFLISCILWLYEQ